MKKLLVSLFTILIFIARISAQDCNCGSVKFLVGQWKCQGKNAAGYPVYSGILNIGNGPSCTFKLVQIMQQVGGDVSIAMPVSVPPNTIVNLPITFTDNPPFIGAGNTGHFIIVYTRGNTNCKTEIQSAPLPACDEVVCKCNPNGWQPFTAKIKNQTQTVKCGFQFGLTCADSIRLNGLYKCLGNCHTKYTAVLKNTATNTVVQNYASFSFPWNYQFATPGTYSLEITPICGNEKCTPCRFFFTVKECNTACDCNDNGWSKFELVSATGDKTILTCGSKTAVKKGVPEKLLGKYTCKGNCEAKYRAVLINNATNAVVQTFPAFSFPFTYNFPAAGVFSPGNNAHLRQQKVQALCTLFCCSITL